MRTAEQKTIQRNQYSRPESRKAENEQNKNIFLQRTQISDIQQPHKHNIQTFKPVQHNYNNSFDDDAASKVAMQCLEHTTTKATT